MKSFYRNPLLLTVLLAALDLMLAARATAQTFTVLHTFTATFPDASRLYYTNSDGANPNVALVLSSNTLYGAANGGGFNGSGTVYGLNTDGTGFTNLHNFGKALWVQGPTRFNIFTNSDGASPYGRLILSGSMLYGTTGYGGTNGNGTIFRINTDGTGFTNLHIFTAGYTNSWGVYTNCDGTHPQAGLVLSDGTLYGTASGGGSSGNGSLFSVDTNGMGFTNLHSFAVEEGISPQGLVVAGNMLYGLMLDGGSRGGGSMFAVSIDGSGFTDLYSFAGDAFYPLALIVSGDTLYGTTAAGGSLGHGTVFSVNTDGTGFTSLYSFADADNNPEAGLSLSGNTLYGATVYGGSSGDGALFGVYSDGSGFTNLYSFTTSDGINPSTQLVLSGQTLYGTASYGGNGGGGTVFSLSLAVVQPQLTITPFGANVILTWPTNDTSLTLQSSTSLASPVWTTNSPIPVVVNGLNTVTNPMSGTQQFFRLSL